MHDGQELVHRRSDEVVGERPRIQFPIPVLRTDIGAAQHLGEPTVCDRQYSGLHWTMERLFRSRKRRREEELPRSDARPEPARTEIELAGKTAVLHHEQCKIGCRAFRIIAGRALKAHEGSAGAADRFATRYGVGVTCLVSRRITGIFGDVTAARLVVSQHGLPPVPDIG
jgi:hypothetical protein